MSDDPLADLIRKRRAERKRQLSQDPEKEFQRLALRMFLTVGFGFTLIMFSVVLIGMTILFASSNTILTRPLRVYVPYTFGGAIISGIVGFFILKRELMEDPNPHVPVEYKHEINQMLRKEGKL